MRFVVFWDPSDPPCRMRNAHLGPALKLLRHSWERGPNRPNSGSNSFWVFCTRQHDYCKLKCHPVSKSVSVRLWCRLFVKITVSFVAWVDENETTTLLPVQSVRACKSTLTHRYPHWRHAAQLQKHLYWPESNMPSWQMQGKDYMHNYMWWKLTPDFIQGSVGAGNPIKPIKLDLPDRITTPATFKTATLLRCGPVDVAIRQFRQPQQKPPGGNSGCGPNFQTSAGFH